jgi:hypothetical protein
MSKNNKVETKVETVENPEVETKVETVVEDTDILETDEQKEHRKEVQGRTFVDGQFTVKANLKHNGKRYEVGDSISLTESESIELLANGTIE